MGTQSTWGMNSSSFNFFYNIQRFVLFKRLIIGYSNIRIIIFFIFIYFKMISYYNYINIAFVFLFITLRVAEARVGISLLTILVRVHGEDIILTKNTQKKKKKKKKKK